MTLTNVNGDLLLMDGPQGTSTTATTGDRRAADRGGRDPGHPGRIAFRHAHASDQHDQHRDQRRLPGSRRADPDRPSLAGVAGRSTVRGTYLQVSGTGVNLTIGGQTLTGDITFTSGGGLVVITLANVTLGLGDGTTNFVNVSNGSGTLSIVSSSSANNNQGGVYGQFGGSVAIDVPGVSFAGTLQVQFNTTGVTQGGHVAAERLRSPAAASTDRRRRPDRAPTASRSASRTGPLRYRHPPPRPRSRSP